MGLEFLLCSEGNVALALALLVRTDMMSSCEMLFQAVVVLVVSVFKVVAAQVTSQMHSTHMILELNIVIEVFLAEVTPRVRKDFRSLLRSRVSSFNVRSQFIKMVNSLFPYEDSPAFNTNFAVSFLVLLLKMDA
jgi:hypothetical protein